MHKRSFLKEKGSALVEIIVGSAIMLVGILAISSAFNTYLQYALANQRNIEATYIMDEGIEAMNFLRDVAWKNNFGSLSTTTTYYLYWNGARWATTTSVQYVDGFFLRSVNIYDVKRDANDDISASGTYDPNTKLVTVSVSYLQGHNNVTKTISKYIANIR